MASQVPTRGGVALRRWREAHDHTRTQVAHMLGCSYFWIRLLEDRGRVPSKSLAKLIGAIADIPPEHWTESAEAA